MALFCCLISSILLSRACSLSAHSWGWNLLCKTGHYTQWRCRDSATVCLLYEYTLTGSAFLPDTLESRSLSILVRFFALTTSSILNICCFFLLYALAISMALPLEGLLEYSRALVLWCINPYIIHCHTSYEYMVMYAHSQAHEIKS